MTGGGEDLGLIIMILKKNKRYFNNQVSFEDILNKGRRLCLK